MQDETPEVSGAGKMVFRGCAGDIPRSSQGLFVSVWSVPRICNAVAAADHLCPHYRIDCLRRPLLCCHCCRCRNICRLPIPDTYLLSHPTSHHFPPSPTIPDTYLLSRPTNHYFPPSPTIPDTYLLSHPNHC